jgi:hypothetical protein
MKKLMCLCFAILFLAGCKTLSVKPSAIGISPDNDFNAFKSEIQGDQSAIKGDISAIKSNVDKLALALNSYISNNMSANIGANNTSTSQSAGGNIKTLSKVDNDTGLMKNYLWSVGSIFLGLVSIIILLINKIFNLMKRKEYYKEQAYVRAKPSEYEKIRKMHDLYVKNKLKDGAK